MDDTKNYLRDGCGVRFSKDITDEEIKEQLFIAYKQRCEKQRERYNKAIEEIDCECGKKVCKTYMEKHKLTFVHSRRMEKLKHAKV